MHKGDSVTQIEIRTLKTVFLLVGRSERHGFLELACLDELLDARLELPHFLGGSLGEHSSVGGFVLHLGHLVCHFKRLFSFVLIK